jgi:hypothetical protein
LLCLSHFMFVPFFVCPILQQPRSSQQMESDSLWR